MVTLGVDVAHRPEATAACWIRWGEEEAAVERVLTPLEHDELRKSVEDPAVEKAGVDIPLGWPCAFLEAMGAQAADRPWPLLDDPRRLAFRATDRWVEAHCALRPLSVSADRIALPAMRVARVLKVHDRSGEGRVVEAYPALALKQWLLPHRRYKRPIWRAALGDLLSSLRGLAPWLVASDDTWGACRSSDHVFDALLCALIARAHARGLCLPIPEEHREEATREGWIAVPRPDALSALP